MKISKPSQCAAALILAAAWCGAVQAQTSPQSDRTTTQQQSQDRGSSAQRSQDRDQSAQPSRQRSEDRDSSARRGGGKDDDKVARGDRRFIQNAMQHGVAEVELANMAANKASNEQVKKFAQQMVQDHTRANDELKRIAASNNVTIAADIDRSDQRRMKNLEKMSGAEFDRRFMEEMVKAHERDLKDFRNAARDARDPELKAFAEKTAKAIEQHLSNGQQVASAVGAKSERTARRGDRDSATSGSSRDENRARSGERDTTGRPDDNRARDSASGTSRSPERSGSGAGGTR